MQISVKKTLTIFLVLLLALGCLGAEGSLGAAGSSSIGAGDSNSLGGGSRFQLSPALDVALSVGSVSLVGGNYLWEKNTLVPAYNGTPSVALDDLNFLDRCAVFKYNSTLDKVSTISTVGILLVPGVLVLKGFLQSGEGSVDGAVGVSAGWTYGLMYAETIALTYGIKELCKNLVIRQRPYLYFKGYPVEEVSNGDYCRSFLSGHTSLAFASATYLTTVLCLEREDVSGDGSSQGRGLLGSFKWPVIATSYALATAIATTRVLSGNHYITDVLAGALLGSLCGLAVPLLHTINSDTFSAHISPAGVYVGVRI